MALDNTILLVVGDWNDDGHGETATYSYDCSVGPDELEKGFKRGSELLRFDLTEYCQNYEDNGLAKEVVEKLYNLGVYLECRAWPDEPAFINSDEYVAAYMAIAKYGHGALEYKQTETKSISIGGYGLF